MRFVVGDQVYFTRGDGGVRIWRGEIIVVHSGSVSDTTDIVIHEVYPNSLLTHTVPGDIWTFIFDSNIHLVPPLEQLAELA